MPTTFEELPGHTVRLDSEGGWLVTPGPNGTGNMAFPASFSAEQVVHMVRRLRAAYEFGKADGERKVWGKLRALLECRD